MTRRYGAPLRPSGSRGFSLVEVILSIGLVSFVLLVILQLLPTGLSSLQGSNRQIVETEIFNTIGSELTGTAYTDLTDYQTTRFHQAVYFDMEGIETKQQQNAVYFVRCDLAAPEMVSGEVRRATVRIGFHQDPGDVDTPSIPTSKRTYLLVNKGS